MRCKNRQSCAWPWSMVQICTHTSHSLWADNHSHHYHMNTSKTCHPSPPLAKPPPETRREERLRERKMSYNWKRTGVEPAILFVVVLFLLAFEVDFRYFVIIVLHKVLYLLYSRVCRFIFTILSMRFHPWQVFGWLLNDNSSATLIPNNRFLAILHGWS